MHFPWTLNVVKANVNVAAWETVLLFCSVLFLHATTILLSTLTFIDVGLGTKHVINCPGFLRASFFAFDQRERQRKKDELAAKAAKMKLWRLNKKKSENKKKKKVNQNNRDQLNHRSHKIQKLTAAELRQEQWRRQKLQTEYTKHEEEFSFLAAAINRLWDNTSLLCKTRRNRLIQVH